MKNRKLAEQIYNQHQTAKSNYNEEIWGQSYPNKFGYATLDEIESHFDMIDRTGDEFRVALNKAHFDFGVSEDVVREKAAAKSRMMKRGAGARALVAKYGKSDATAIIANKSGKSFNLK